MNTPQKILSFLAIILTFILIGISYNYFIINYYNSNLLIIVILLIITSLLTIILISSLLSSHNNLLSSHDDLLSSHDDLLSSHNNLLSSHDNLLRSHDDQLASFHSALRLIQSRLFLAESSSPKEVMIEEVIHSLIKYEYLSLKKSEDTELMKKLNEYSRYERGQNFYYRLERGTIVAEKQLLYITDHPFTPLSTNIIKLMKGTTKQIGIGAVPDKLYKIDDIQARIDFINSNKGGYFLLPPEEVHLSLLIFDETYAMIYTTPINRKVCNYSEVLVIENNSFIKDELVPIFNYIYDLAKKRYEGNQNAVKEELDNLIKRREFEA